jgi:hypothetical protein
MSILDGFAGKGNGNATALRDVPVSQSGPTITGDTLAFDGSSYRVTNPHVANIATLRTVNGSRGFQAVTVAARVTSGDMAPRVARWRVSAPPADDGWHVIRVAGVSVGYWELDWDGRTVLLEWFGDVTASDCSAAMAAAISATPNGGTVRVPASQCRFTGQIDLSGNIQGIEISGAARGSDCALSYFGTAPQFVKLQRSGNVTFRNLTISAASAYTGVLLDTGDDGHASDNLVIDHCYLSGAGATGISLTSSVTPLVVGCSFTGCNVAIEGLRAGYAEPFSNGAVISNNFFISPTYRNIVNPGEGWNISGNSFEPVKPPAYTATGIWNTPSLPCRGVDVHGNWFGDCWGEGDGWIALSGTGIDIHGNQFWAARSVGIRILSGSHGVHVHGNKFHGQGSLVAAVTCATDDTVTGVCINANDFLDCSTAVTGYTHVQGIWVVGNSGLQDYTDTANQYGASIHAWRGVPKRLAPAGRSTVGDIVKVWARADHTHEHGAAHFGTGAFAAKTDSALPATAQPYAVIAANLKGRARHVDVITANYGTDNVSILPSLGDGSGGFGTRVDYAVGVHPMGVSAGDLFGDGHASLAVACAGSNKVYVLRGDGSGALVVAGNYSTNTNPLNVALGNLRTNNPRTAGSATLDVVVACQLANKVSVLLNNGDGTFAAKVDYSTGTQPAAVALADLRGIGVLDIIVTNGGANTVSVLLGNGDGTFAAKVDYATGVSPHQVTVGDTRNNGVLDLVVAAQGSHRLSVLLGNGDGTFAAKVDYVTAREPTGVELVDLTGCGRLDAVVACSGADNCVSVLLGNGDGTFAAKVDYATGVSPIALTVADLRGIGRDDVVTANYGAASVSMLGAVANGTKAAHHTLASLLTGSPATLTQTSTDPAVTELQNALKALGLLS